MFPPELRSPATSTRALFSTFATDTAMTGMASVVVGTFAPFVAATIWTLMPAFACRLAILPARTEPVSPRVTLAVFVLSTQSASQLNPNWAARLDPISETFHPFQVVLSKVVVASAYNSTTPSDSILPFTSTVAVLEVSIIIFSNSASGFVGAFSYLLFAVDRRMMSPESSAAGFMVTVPTSNVAFVSTLPLASFAFTRPVKSRSFWLCSTAPLATVILLAPSTMPLRVLIFPWISMAASEFNSISSIAVNVPPSRLLKLAISWWNW